MSNSNGIASDPLGLARAGSLNLLDPDAWTVAGSPDYRSEGPLDAPTMKTDATLADVLLRYSESARVAVSAYRDAVAELLAARDAGEELAESYRDELAAWRSAAASSGKAAKLRTLESVAAELQKLYAGAAELKAAARKAAREADRTLAELPLSEDWPAVCSAVEDEYRAAAAEARDAVSAAESALMRQNVAASAVAWLHTLDLSAAEVPPLTRDGLLGNFLRRFVRREAPSVAVGQLRAHVHADAEVAERIAPSEELAGYPLAYTVSKRRAGEPIVWKDGTFSNREGWLERAADPSSVEHVISRDAPERIVTRKRTRLEREADIPKGPGAEPTGTVVDETGERPIGRDSA